MPQSSVKILIIENNLVLCREWEAYLNTAENLVYETQLAPTLQEAIERIHNDRFDLILLDLSLPDGTGMEAFSKIRFVADQIPILVVSDPGDAKELEEAVLAAGAHDFHVKGEMSRRLFMKSIRYAVEACRMREELNRRDQEEEIVFNSTRTMIWHKDVHNRILRVNKAAAEAMGKSPLEIKGKHVEDVFPNEAEKQYQDDREVIHSRKPKLGIVELYQMGAGKKRWILTDKLPVFDTKGKVTGILAFSTDITIQKMVEEKLEYRVQFEKLVTNVAAHFISLTSDKIEEGISKALGDIARFIAADRAYIFRFFDVGSENQHFFEYCAPGIDTHLGRLEGLLLEHYPGLIAKIRKSETFYLPHLSSLYAEASEEADELSSRGIRSMIWVPLVYESRAVGFLGFDWVRGEKEWTQNVIGFLKIIGEMIVNALEHKKSQDRMERLIYYDSLTDLPNRTLFIDRLNQGMTRAKRDEHMLAVLHVDVDQFKRINDTLGRGIGDRLIVEIAGRLKKILCETDTITRLAGDEFAILIPRIQLTDDLFEIVNKVFGVFKQPYHAGDHELHMTCSIGSCVYPTDGLHADALLKNADAAKYHAKQQGRNAYKRYVSVMNSRSLERLTLENHLRHAIEHEELRVYYQPQVNVRNGKIGGLEALVRWQHPTIGMIAPNDFIPLAEDTGLIIPIGAWVLETACRQVAEWHRQGLELESISVNLSFQQIENGDLIKTVADILSRTGLEPGFLELELTENMIMRNVEETIKTLERLKTMGVRISIDDFGTGQSSLGYLKRFPIDTLKIDRSFVRDLIVDAGDEAIAKAIISMAQSLNINVIAEGVETSDQLDFLYANGCYKVQGFFFSRPVPHDVCRKLLADGGFPKFSKESVA